MWCLSHRCPLLQYLDGCFGDGNHVANRFQYDYKEKMTCVLLTCVLDLVVDIKLLSGTEVWNRDLIHPTETKFNSLARSITVPEESASGKRTQKEPQSNFNKRLQGTGAELRLSLAGRGGGHQVDGGGSSAQQRWAKGRPLHQGRV
jgi:hypothetical protein